MQFIIKVEEFTYKFGTEVNLCIQLRLEDSNLYLLQPLQSKVELLLQKETLIMKFQKQQQLRRSNNW